MNQQQVIQFAVRCLSELDAQAGEAISYHEIARRLGIPLMDCVRVLRSLINAGIVRLASAGLVRLSRPIEELTALEIVDAVWAKADKAAAFQMLVGANQSMECRKTLEIIYASSGIGING